MTNTAQNSKKLIVIIRSYWPLLLFILMWVGVVAYREPLRFKWWEMRLRSAADDSRQLYYFGLLSSVGQSALPTARSLVQDEDPGIRSLGVGILHHIEGQQAHVLLQTALDDYDSGVREMALVGLAMRRDTEVLSRLHSMAEGGNSQQALTAVIALGEYECAEVSQILCMIARRHSNPLIRAQAIEQLGFLGCREAIPVLIDVLDDNAPYKGTTVLQQMDEQALRELSKQRSAVGDRPYSLSRPRAVSDQAAMSLRMIAGQSFGFRSTDDPDRRRAARTAWRQWWARQLVG